MWYILKIGESYILLHICFKILSSCSSVAEESLLACDALPWASSQITACP
jgi:hypothetical protein